MSSRRSYHSILIFWPTISFLSLQILLFMTCSFFFFPLNAYYITYIDLCRKLSLRRYALWQWVYFQLIIRVIYEYPFIICQSFNCNSYTFVSPTFWTSGSESLLTSNLELRMSAVVRTLVSLTFRTFAFFCKWHPAGDQFEVHLSQHPSLEQKVWSKLEFPHQEIVVFKMRTSRRILCLLGRRYPCWGIPRDLLCFFMLVQQILKFTAFPCINFVDPFPLQFEALDVANVARLELRIFEHHCRLRYCVTIQRSQTSGSPFFMNKFHCLFDTTDDCGQACRTDSKRPRWVLLHRYYTERDPHLSCSSVESLCRLSPLGPSIKPFLNLELELSKNTKNADTRPTKLKFNVNSGSA